jgi:bacterioferritin (cytochrome b1)
MAVTKNAVTPDMLVSELQNLLRLTAFEQTIAAVRRSQSATSSISEELKANYAKSVERSQLLQDAVRQAGGVPDVVGSALSKAGAFLQTQVNQVQTLQGALLGDLALEHQLRERTRYARALAERLGYVHLMPVFERLDVAHTATIEWLEARLTEVAQTGTSALQPTPVQALVGATRKVALLPFGVFAATVNRGTSLVRRGASSAADAAGTAAETAAGTARDGVQATAGAVAEGARTAAETVSAGASVAADVVDEGADKAADATSRAAQATGDAVEGAARATEQAAQTEVEQVLDLRDVDEDKAPFAGYDSLSGDSVMRHARDSEDVEHLREILAYEQAHKARKGVLGALNDRLTELAGASA